MTKNDRQLTDFLGTCWRVDKYQFATNYFLVSCMVQLYKRYGEKFIDLFHGRTHDRPTAR
jgi:hypothetical protein